MGRRKTLRGAVVLSVLGLAWACGGETEFSPRGARAQAVVIDDEFVCPMDLVPAYRSGSVGICTDGILGIEEVPPSVCTDAGLSSCAQLQPVSPTMPEEQPAEGTDVEAANCEDLELRPSTTSSADASCSLDTPEECPEGTHLFFGLDSEPSSCAVCAADTERNRTCEWAEKCFEAFIESAARDSGAQSCRDDADCFGWTVSAGCGPMLDIALYGGVDEEILLIAELYAQQSCSLCPTSTGYSAGTSKGTAHCVEGTCTFE
jgi:hypothetical protein